jgi:hypothetical protein
MKYSGTLTPPEIVSSAPLTAFMLATASGHASHLGPITVAYPHYLNLEDGAFSGLETLTVVNGDRLTIDLKGQSIPVSPNEFDLTLSGNITGGTGRYSAATGGLTGTGHASLNTLTVSVSLAGCVSLNGLDQDLSGDDD